MTEWKSRKVKGIRSKKRQHSPHEAGALRVWWIRNPPNEAHHYSVETISQAKHLLEKLADKDSKNMGVVSNVGGLTVWNGESWVEYQDDDGDDIDQITTPKRIDRERKAGMHTGL